MQRHDVVAQNLANFDMPGYRGQDMIFETFDLSGGNSAPGHETGDILGTRPTGVYNVFEPGAYQFTANAFDVAISGQGFFVVDGPNGPLYTRNGTFEINAQGELQTKSGLPVAGAGGRIVIPPMPPRSRSRRTARSCRAAQRLASSSSCASPIRTY
jgi:flagellar hook-basal body protein